MGLEPIIYRLEGDRIIRLCYTNILNLVDVGFEPTNPRKQSLSLSVLTAHPIYHLFTSGRE